MEKGLRKPTHWQDFESLCKKLWGEIWEIPNKIKKNGRLGQNQSGVDISGIPKDEIEYWGIQCKGKDDYTHAKLTAKEVDEEIEKASKFQPKLKVFIIATTSNKDSEIEEYVRKKDIESRNNGDFEILLYCWEDIVDLIESNKETFDYYVNEQKYQTKYSLKAYLNDFKNEVTIHPAFERFIIKYRVVEKINSQVDLLSTLTSQSQLKIPLINRNPFGFGEPTWNVNDSKCSFELIIANEGNAVIEDWRVVFTIDENFKKISDTISDSIYSIITPNRRVYIEKNQITYYPLDNEPLIQKDNRYFRIYIIPDGREYEIPVRWKVLARDYNDEGILTIQVKPTFEDETHYNYVDTEDEIIDDEIQIFEKRRYDKNYKEDWR
jgi:hypothetical protein